MTRRGVMLLAIVAAVILTSCRVATGENGGAADGPSAEDVEAYLATNVGLASGDGE